MDLDEFKIKDEIELMNIQRKMELTENNINPILGFNIDTIYNEIENL